jgi:toxin ParE1/3/4
MAFKIIVSPKAQTEIEDAIDYYSRFSKYAPINFIKSLLRTYRNLENGPYFKIQYRNIRAIKLYKFPYSLYFEIDENEKVVAVLSCFHNKRNPKNLPGI